MLRELKFQGVYKSDHDHILDDFYFPALSVASRYDRAVGFFSAGALSLAAQALSTFVKRGGCVRLILGAFTDEEEFEAVVQGHRVKEMSEQLGQKLLGRIESVSDDLFQNRLETLSWLVAYGRLEVKIALRAQGMYHDKVGIISDESGDKVVFSGSANESRHALLPTHNYESINVFRTWIPEHAEFYEPHIASFERLWRNESPATVVFDIPTAVKEQLVVVARALTYTPDPEVEARIAAQMIKGRRSVLDSTSHKPRVPAAVAGKRLQMRSHQVAALEAWRSKGDWQGTLDLATGAGKTITAIHAIVKLSEAIDGLVCVIAVPYQSLAEQWVETLAAFNVHPVKCYIARVQWDERLRRLVHELSIGSRSFGAIVVVNKTLKSTLFQQCLSRFKGNRLLWIGDECHHHNAKAYEGYLPEHARYRMGLSATPQHYLDEERNERLSQYYGAVVYRYSLKEAIQDEVLAAYEYYPHIVEFTEQETEEFVGLSEEIGRMLARQGAKAKEIPSHVTGLLMRRARLMGAASNKLATLRSLLSDQKPTSHTLFYCGDGTVEAEEDDGEGEDSQVQGKRQVEAVSAMLHERGWDVSRFTAREAPGVRKVVLENFRLGIIHALVAIRCLDEGMDVPACSTAYILASSRDPRQFVQRRGRILRRSPGKKLAVVHDFVVVLPGDYDTESVYAKRLIKSELARVAEFSSLSRNRADAYMRLAPILDVYDLEYVI